MHPSKKQTKAKWTMMWNKGKETATHLRGMSKRHAFENRTKIYNNISNRQQMAWLVRLRTGHCSLNSYLHRFGKEEEPTCECGENNETVSHFLLRCERFARQREKLIKEVGIGGMRVEELLGDHKHVKYTLKYVKETKRFTF